MVGQLSLGFGNREGRRYIYIYIYICMYLIMLIIELAKVRWRLARGLVKRRHMFCDFVPSFFGEKTLFFSRNWYFLYFQWNV